MLSRRLQPAAQSRKQAALLAQRHGCEVGHGGMRVSRGEGGGGIMMMTTSVPPSTARRCCMARQQSSATTAAPPSRDIPNSAVPSFCGRTAYEDVAMCLSTTCQSGQDMRSLGTD
ncbi:hypothetical protein BD289DRAFT_266509 [Coniella lustricola]|uniref:Uncharacterized protein n=1 Tax=Coniella lustricola TaxID=2025994 RepID=A0A2T3A7A0_9PEZI|nr:hypothetical protein BD289DRAFT_266509 [Coniella lustricola]